MDTKTVKIWSRVVVLLIPCIGIAIALLNMGYKHYISIASEYRFTIATYKGKQYRVGQGTKLKYRYQFDQEVYNSTVSNEKIYSDLPNQNGILIKVFIDDPNVSEILEEYVVPDSFDVKSVPLRGWIDIPEMFLSD